MQKHTPGPWEAMPESWREHHVDISAKDWGALAIVVVNVDGEPSEIGEANARLIAAAPDLLAALQGVLRVADRATVEFDAARAAILKATGGAS